MKRRVVGDEGRLKLTLVITEAKEADDVGVVEVEDDVELQVEGMVQALAGAKDLGGSEGVGRGGRVVGWMVLKPPRNGEI